MPRDFRSSMKHLAKSGSLSLCRFQRKLSIKLKLIRRSLNRLERLLVCQIYGGISG